MSSITNIEYHLPSKAITNQVLANEFGLTQEDIFKKSKINIRYATAPGEYGSQLSEKAAEKLFIRHPALRDKIDFVLFCTEGLDLKGPATACLIQDRLKLPHHVGALDIPYGCTGFVYGLMVAQGLIAANTAKCILLLVADTPTKVIHPEDLELRLIFGDAGVAAIIESGNTEGIGKFVFGTDGSGAENLIVRNSGTLEHLSAEWFQKYADVGGLPDGRMEMNGMEIFQFALRKVPVLYHDTLKKNNLAPEQIDLVILHQASDLILRALKRKLEIPDEKFFTYFSETGNTVSASIPIALHEAARTGKLKSGDKVLILGFGIGYSWAGTVITWI